MSKFDIYFSKNVQIYKNMKCLTCSLFKKTLLFNFFK